MIVGIIFALSLAAMVIGAVSHFWILLQLQSNGVPGKFMAHISDNLQAYRRYKDIAQRTQLPLWPLYVTISGLLGGLLGACTVLLANPSFLDYVRGFWRR